MCGCDLDARAPGLLVAGLRCLAPLLRCWVDCLLPHRAAAAQACPLTLYAYLCAFQITFEEGPGTMG